MPQLGGPGAAKNSHLLKDCHKKCLSRQPTCLTQTTLTYTQSKNCSRFCVQSSRGSMLFLAFLPKQNMCPIFFSLMVKKPANEAGLKTSGVYSWHHQTSPMRKSSLGLNLVKHRPETGPGDPGIWLYKPAVNHEWCTTHDELCLESIVLSRYLHSFYHHHLFNRQESDGHCLLQRSLSVGAKSGAVLSYTPQAKSSTLLALA